MKEETPDSNVGILPVYQINPPESRYTEKRAPADIH
jgi:hypothetical protein